MAHALSNHKGPCHHIHGHSYKLQVTVSGKPVTHELASDYGMVMDFQELKRIVNDHVIAQFDHVLVLHDSDKKRFPGIEEITRTVFVPFAPSCEMLLVHFCETIRTQMPAYVHLHAMRLDETATSWAEWLDGDNL
jgi:6-pyruvoyltetrahydropterin/6-carboxytetrahydropterin synthase